MPEGNPLFKAIVKTIETLTPGYSTKSRLGLFGASMYDRVQKNITSVNTSAKLKSKNPLDTFENDRVSSLKGFSELKDGGDKPQPLAIASKISKRLKHPTDQLTFVDNAIQETLQMTDPMKAAKKDFDENIESMNDLLMQHDQEVDLLAMRQYLKEEKNTVKSAIEAQHTEENRKIGELFDKPDFITNLKASMGLTSDAEVEPFKTDMLNALKQAQEKQISQLEKTISDEVQKLEKHLELESIRIANLDIMAERSETIRKAILEKSRNNALNEGNLQVDYDPDKSQALYKGINLTDLPYLKSLSGTNINITPGSTKDSVNLSLQLPKWGFLYYNSRHKNVLYDLTSMAMAIRGLGHNRITMNVNHEDEEYAMEIGRQQYEACLRAGFNPNSSDEKKPNITIKVNGKAKTVDELFGNYPQRLSAIKEKYNKLEEGRKQLLEKPVDTAKFNQFKAQVTSNRNRLHPATDPGAAPAPAPGGAPGRRP